MLAKSGAARTEDQRSGIQGAPRGECHPRPAKCSPSELRHSGPYGLTTCSMRVSCSPIIKQPVLQHGWTICMPPSATAALPATRGRQTACATSVRNAQSHDRKTALEKVSEAAERREQQAKTDGKAVHGVLVAGLEQLPCQVFPLLHAGAGRRYRRLHHPRSGRVHPPARLRQLPPPALAARQRGALRRCRVGQGRWSRSSYQTTVVTAAKDRSGIVLDIAAVLNVLNAKVRTLSARDNGAGTAVTSVTLEVKDSGRA